ncbi:MAG: hypothetical protein A3I83_09490 [Methylotenera sp. RIFCSPLOWO2_02_FULL_45_14]|nr:MAG: hypothetical protein A3I83_09490 [Methylotenera sp. RIFCSPLOWO2_02_FULL_45_14]
MAYDAIYFENPHNGQIKEASVGFSWTTLLFGPFPMLFRGNWKWFAIILILALITFGLTNLIFMFIINKLYIKDLIGDGFKVKSIKVGPLNKIATEIGFPLPILNASSVTADEITSIAHGNTAKAGGANNSLPWIMIGVVLVLMFALLGGEKEKLPETEQNVGTQKDLESASSTSTPTISSIFGSDDKGMKELKLLEQRWYDAIVLASSTPRISLSGPISNLQSISRDLETTEVSDCLGEAKASLSVAMATMVQANLMFLQQDESSANSLHEEANNEFNKYKQLRDKCL